MRSECVALLLVLSMCLTALPATFYVDDDAPGDEWPGDSNYSDPKENGSAGHPFDSIQEAIDVAQDGDAIVVAPGHYLSRDTWAYAELKFKGKSIRLVSSAPTSLDTANEIVLCGVVIFDGTEDPNCLLQGFKIQNYGYGGILGNKTHAAVSHCIISGNGPCGATVIKDVYGRITNCLVVDNASFHDCGILPVISGCHVLINCTVANNLSGVTMTNEGLPTGGDVIVRNCIFSGNKGFQLNYLDNPVLQTNETIAYCLIEDWNPVSPALPRGRTSALMDADPCFVQPGYWVDVTTTRRPTTRGEPSVETTEKVLIEGDYHLRSEGWRWSSRPLHGSHWLFDLTTSAAVDAGDPIDGLGEELERAPEDPEGQWGFNHAMDLGAYGGTGEGSLSPTRDSLAPGVGAVDLHDYWPLAAENSWAVHCPDGIAAQLRTTGEGHSWTPRASVTTWGFRTTSAPNWASRLEGMYIDHTFYIIGDSMALYKLPEITDQFRALCPQYIIVGATIQTPFDAFVEGTVEFRSALITRGTLAEVLAGTSVNPSQFVPGAWLDVIAFKETTPGGVTGEPMTIFARGFGPLMIGGQPVEEATVAGKSFRTAQARSGRRVVGQ